MRRNGFSLVELMITVAIIGILSAIAIPNFQRQQLMAKRSEAMTILTGAGDAERAYEVLYDRYIEAPSNPAATLDKGLKNWNTSTAGWSSLGYRPDGQVRCNYVVQCFGGSFSGDCAGQGAYPRVGVTCDVDNDNVTYQVRLYVDNGASNCCSGNTPDGFVHVGSSSNNVF